MKKMLCLGMALVLVLSSLLGCAQDGGNSSKNDSQTPSKTEESSKAEASAAEESSQAGSDEIGRAHV